MSLSEYCTSNCEAKEWKILPVGQSIKGSHPWWWRDDDVAVGNGEMRYALVKKTVAYIVTDEDQFGNAVTEKWNIKGHRSYDVPTLLVEHLKRPES